MLCDKETGIRLGEGRGGASGTCGGRPDSFNDPRLMANPLHQVWIKQAEEAGSLVHPGQLPGRRGRHADQAEAERPVQRRREVRAEVLRRPEHAASADPGQAEAVMGGPYPQPPPPSAGEGVLHGRPGEDHEGRDPVPHVGLGGRLAVRQDQHGRGAGRVRRGQQRRPDRGDRRRGRSASGWWGWTRAGSRSTGSRSTGPTTTCAAARSPPRRSRASRSRSGTSRARRWASRSTSCWADGAATG